MDHLSQALDLNAAVLSTTWWTIVILMAGGGVGLAMRRPWLEGQAIGLLILFGASDLALYMARGMGLSLPAFAAIALGVATGLTVALRRMIFAGAARRPVDGLVWPIFLGFAAIFLALRLTTPFPQSGYSIFQALFPAYLNHTLAVGVFESAAQMPMGDGFFAGNHLNYPADTLGLAALVLVLAGGTVQAVYLASSIAAGIAAIGIVLYGAARNRVALLVGAVLLLVFLRFGNALRLVILDNWIDNILALAGAVSLYFLMCGDRRSSARLGASFAAGLMVFSRPFGLLYAAALALPLFIDDMRRLDWRPQFVRWLALGGVLAVLGAREIDLLLTGGIYHAQPAYREGFGFDSTGLVAGTLGDWGLRLSSHLALPVPMATFFLAALAMVALSRRNVLMRRPTHLLSLLAPVLMLIGPLVVEMVTGYRRGLGDFNKLYIGAAFIFPAAPALLLTKVKWGRLGGGWLSATDRRLPRLAWVATILVAMVAGGMTAGPGRSWVTSKFANIVGTYSRNNVDLMLAEHWRDNLTPEDFQRISSRRILFLYHEPGMGLRYFIGGDFFNDHDFFGAKVQDVIAAGASIENLLARLDYPNIWVSFPSWRTAGKLSSYRGWEAVADQIDALTPQNPMVAQEFRVGSARFLEIRRP